MFSTEALQVLKPACVSALKRIFKLCDVNKDGVLHAVELNEFQVCLLSTSTPGSAKHEAGSENASMRLYSYRNLKASRIWFANMQKVACEIMG
jgi:hypothetical protein